MLLTVAALACGDPGDRPPNLLLITIDTLRADALACYGGAPDAGTRVCSVADAGMRFTWALSTAPATAPAIASLLTGRFPAGHAVSQIGTSQLAPEHRTVAEMLADAGYDTGAVVSNPVLARGRGLDQGFAHYDDRMTRHERNRPALREREAADTTAAALEFLAAADEPWFLWVHYQDPHGPYEPPGAPPPVDRPGDPPLAVLRHQSGYGGIPAYQALAGVRTARAYEEAYANEVAYLDRHLGELLAAVERGRPPFVLVTADHGEALGEDGYWFAHGHSLGLDQLRVPLLVRPAGGQPPQIATAPVSTASVAATLLAAAGLPVPDGVDAPRLPIPSDAPAAPAAEPGPIVAEHPHRVAVVVGDRYYARDVGENVAGRRDPVSGGVIWPLPARSSRLRPDGSAGGYTPGRPLALESLLADYDAERRRGTPASADGPALSERERKALEALGYLE